MKGNGMPASGTSMLEIQMKQMTEPVVGEPDWRSWLPENLPRFTTFPDKPRLLGAIALLETADFWRDLVIARRRTWTPFDTTREFWVERRGKHGDWTLGVLLAYPGQHYPYRAFVGIPFGDRLHGRSPAQLIKHAEGLIVLGAVDSHCVRNIRAIDECGLDDDTREWRVSFRAGAFFEDVDWAYRNAEEIAEQLEVLSGNALPAKYLDR